MHQRTVRIGAINYKLYSDVQVQSYVNVVGNRLVPDFAKDPRYQQEQRIFFRFYVVADPVPNAYAFPNGMVFVNTGLLKPIDNEAQLAAVLSHEIAPVTYEHASKRMKQNAYLDSELFGSSLEVLLNKLYPPDVLRPANLSKDVFNGMKDALWESRPSDLSNLFVLAQENEADQVGLTYMYHAGYDLREAVAFWRMMTSQAFDATFQERVRSDVGKLLLSTNVTDANIFSNLTEQATELVVRNMLETI
ncbi:MAG: hypothetical protein OHK0039_11880 [Bacteroidia bacterium]